MVQRSYLITQHVQFTTVAYPARGTPSDTAQMRVGSDHRSHALPRACRHPHKQPHTRHPSDTVIYNTASVRHRVSMLPPFSDFTTCGLLCIAHTRSGTRDGYPSAARKWERDKRPGTGRGQPIHIVPHGVYSSPRGSDQTQPTSRMRS